jgi:hypothetical protein
VGTRVREASVAAVELGITRSRRYGDDPREHEDAAVGATRPREDGFEQVIAEAEHDHPQRQSDAQPRDTAPRRRHCRSI